MRLEHCYLKEYRLYPGIHKAWTRNERIAKRHPDSYFVQIAARVAKAKPRLFRWHVAGDILNTECSLARAGPRRLRHRLRSAAADQHDGDTGHGRQRCQRQKRQREAARGIPDHP